MWEFRLPVKALALSARGLDNHYSGSKQRRRSSSVVENDYEDAAEEVEDDYEEEYDQKKQLLDGNDTFLTIVQIN